MGAIFFVSFRLKRPFMHEIRLDKNEADFVRRRIVIYLHNRKYFFFFSEIGSLTNC